MKKIFLVVALVLMCGVAFASTDISVEPLLNRVVDKTSNTVKMEVGVDSGITLPVVNINTNDTATNTRATLTANSFDTLVSANSARKFLSISIVSRDNVYINLETGGSAVKGEGIKISSDYTTYWEMPAGAIYTGVISCTSSTTGTGIGIIEY